MNFESRLLGKRTAQGAIPYMIEIKPHAAVDDVECAVINLLTDKRTDGLIMSTSAALRERITVPVRGRAYAHFIWDITLGNDYT